MNTKVKQRVAIVIGIWFACALINAFFARPPIREVTQRRVPVAAVAADAQTTPAGNAADAAVLVALPATIVQTTTVASAMPAVADTPLVTETVVATESIVITDSATISLTVEPVTEIAEPTLLTATTDTPSVAAALADTTAAANEDTTPTPSTNAVDPALVTVGENVFQHTAGGVGCQLCHGQDAKGLIGPNIVGKTADDIRFQFENNDQMKFITLTDQEIAAVAVYLQYLANPAAFAMPGGNEGSQPATTTAAAPADPVLASGQEIFQVTAGGVGCQLCHGPDAKGLIGPSIVGKTAEDIRTQFETNDQMKFIVLKDRKSVV